jgi:ABC-type Fe3+ transport system permease subunit
MNDIKSQLLPGWSPVNIGLLVLFFIFFKLFALLMLGYIVFGARLGLDLTRPETFKALWGRVSTAWKSAPPEGGTATRVGGTPEPRVESATDESRN